MLSKEIPKFFFFISATWRLWKSHLDLISAASFVSGDPKKIVAIGSDGSRERLVRLDFVTGTGGRNGAVRQNTRGPISLQLLEFAMRGILQGCFTGNWILKAKFRIYDLFVPSLYFLKSLPSDCSRVSALLSCDPYKIASDNYFKVRSS